jgi:hypothetical protein
MKDITPQDEGVKKFLGCEGSAFKSDSPKPPVAQDFRRNDQISKDVAISRHLWRRVLKVASVLTVTIGFLKAAIEFVRVLVSR